MSTGQRSALEQINVYIGRLHQQKSSDMSLILEYDKKYQDLRVWLWYVDIRANKRSG